MWSIGIMTYYMLAGDPPFNAENDSELFDLIVSTDVPFLDKNWKHASPDAIDFIQKLLVKDAERRLTAIEALKHPWIKQHTGVLSPECEIRIDE